MGPRYLAWPQYAVGSQVHSRAAGMRLRRDGVANTPLLFLSLLLLLLLRICLLLAIATSSGVFVQGAQRIVKQEEDAELNRIVCKATHFRVE